ncbi:hypothetical protein SEA_GIRLPOWER_58 [Streptomyces phage GirlPower]|nr:hypothetical protein SEA_GIRLPOWER_58 [Streptomyces phage GirlPower]
MKFCDAMDFKGGQLWCETHNLPATFLADNGDDYVCEAYAIFAGSQTLNRHKVEMSDLRRAFEFIFDKLIKADNEVEEIVIDEVKKIFASYEED